MFADLMLAANFILQLLAIRAGSAAERAG